MYTIIKLEIFLILNFINLLKLMISYSFFIKNLGFDSLINLPAC